MEQSMRKYLKRNHHNLFRIAAQGGEMPEGIDYLARGSNSSCWWMRVEAVGRRWLLTEYKSSIGKAYVEDLGDIAKWRHY